MDRGLISTVSVAADNEEQKVKQIAEPRKCSVMRSVPVHLRLVAS